MSGEHAIVSSADGIVVCVSAAICAPTRSSPDDAVTATGAVIDSVPVVPVPHVMLAFLLSPHDAVTAISVIAKASPFMCAQRTHRRAKLHYFLLPPKNGPRGNAPITSGIR